MKYTAKAVNDFGYVEASVEVHVIIKRVSEQIATDVSLSEQKIFESSEEVILQEQKKSKVKRSGVIDESEVLPSACEKTRETIEKGLQGENISFE